MTDNHNDEFSGLFGDELLIDIEEPSVKFVEGERREVAILFADVKGFTAMSQKLDPELVHRKMNEIMKIFTKCISLYGGYVDKYMGDGIMALFGAKKATEQDTERAISAGLMMLRQLKLYNALLARQPGFENIELGVRIGVNAGLVSVGKVGAERESDFTVYGAPVNLASRMESNAPVNSLMIPVETMSMVEHLFDFQTVGPKSVKGVDEPVDCYTVTSSKRSKDHRWMRKGTAFVGRKKEMGALQEAMESATPSDVGVAFISGNAGLGKTRLIYEFLKENAQEITPLRAAASGICARPYNLFISLLESMFRLHVNEPISSRKKKLDDACETLTEGLDDDARYDFKQARPLYEFLLDIPVKDVRLKQSKQDLLAHIHQAMDILFHVFDRSVDRQQTVILVLDDVHWIDESSSLLLKKLFHSFFLNNEKRQSSWLILLAHRENDNPLHDAIRSSGVRKIALKPLRTPEIARLVEMHTSGASISQTAKDRVIKLSEGNPFYLEEWCNYISDIPDLQEKDIPVPANLHALILSRLDLLTDSVKLLLQKAAVIGHEFFVDILQEIERRLESPDDMQSTLGELERNTLILQMLGFDYSAYFFKHILTREVAYKTLLFANRKLLHQLTAEAIESLFADDSERFLFALAEHYHQAEIPDKAQMYLRKAAEAAQKAFSNQQAITLWKRYIECLPPDAWREQAHAALQITDIQWLIGQWEGVEEELKRVLKDEQQHSSPEIAFEARRQLGVCHFYQGELDHAEADFQELLRIAGREGDASMRATAHGNLAILRQHAKDFDDAIEHSTLALKYSGDAGDEERTAKTLSNLGMLMLHTGMFAEADDYFKRSLEVAEREQLQKLQSIVLGNLGFMHYTQGDLDRAYLYFEKKWALVKRMDDQLELIKVLGNIGNIRRDRGEHREALEFYRKILNLKMRLGDAKSIASTHYNIAKELIALGLNEEAALELDKAIELVEDIPERVEKYRALQASLKDS